jgi:dynein heavy chain
MVNWLKKLETTLEVVTATAHDMFRCFISSEPPPAPPYDKIIPKSIMQNCIKVADEAPQGLQSNLRRAYAKFDQARLDSAHKQSEFKAVLFGLCMFHSYEPALRESFIRLETISL